MLNNQLRTAAYEVLNTFVQNAANDSLSAVASLSDVIIKRLENTIPLQSQVVSVEDKITLEEMQTSLCTVLLAIIQRLEKEIAPQSNRIMTVLLQILNTAGPKSSVPDAVFATVSSLANALEEGFATYMEAFAPFLYKRARQPGGNPACARWPLVSSATLPAPWARHASHTVTQFMNYLLNNLRVCYTHETVFGTPRDLLQKFSIDIRMNLSLHKSQSTGSCQPVSNLLFFNALEILLVLLVVILRPTYRLLPKSFNRLLVYRLAQMDHMRCSTTSSHCVRVSWTLGVELSVP